MTELLKLLHLVALGDISPKEAESEVRAAVDLGGVGRLPVLVGNEAGTFSAWIYEIGGHAYELGKDGK